MAVQSWLNGESNLELLIAVTNKREERIYPVSLYLSKRYFSITFDRTEYGKSIKNEG